MRGLQTTLQHRSVLYCLRGTDPTARGASCPILRFGETRVRLITSVNQLQPTTSFLELQSFCSTNCHSLYGLAGVSCFIFCSALSRMSLRRSSLSAVSFASSSTAFFAFCSAISFCPSARYASDTLSYTFGELGYAIAFSFRISTAPLISPACI